MQVVEIDDPADERLADYRDLTDAQLRDAMEREAGMFIAEGVQVIRRLVRSPYPVRSVLVTPRRFNTLRADLEAIAAPVFVAPQEVLSGTAGFNIHRGAVASAQRIAAPDPQELLAAATRVVVLEDLTDHENVGAVFRNAAALGVDAVLLSPGCCDPLYRRAVRVSMGNVLAIPHAVIQPWPDGLDMLLAAGFVLLALTPDQTAAPIADTEHADRMAIMLGTEGAGLTAAAMGRADGRIRIPMAAGVDSLNVATAGAIAFYELGRGR